VLNEGESSHLHWQQDSDLALHVHIAYQPILILDITLEHDDTMVVKVDKIVPLLSRGEQREIRGLAVQLSKRCMDVGREKHGINRIRGPQNFYDIAAKVFDDQDATLFFPALNDIRQFFGFDMFEVRLLSFRVLGEVKLEDTTRSPVGVRVKQKIAQASQAWVPVLLRLDKLAITHAAVFRPSDLFCLYVYLAIRES
jgi:hypothetical protein